MSTRTRNVIEGIGWILLAVVVLPFFLISVLLRKAGLFILLTCLPAISGVALKWNASPSPGIASYEVQYGQTSRVYTVSVSFGATNLSGTITNLTFGRWYFSVIARTTNGVASDYSNEVGWTNTAFAPVTLRLTGPTDALVLQSATSAGGPFQTIATITASNSALRLTQQPKQFFRAYSTNLPPLPGGSP